MALCSMVAGWITGGPVTRDPVHTSLQTDPPLIIRFVQPLSRTGRWNPTR